MHAASQSSHWRDCDPAPRMKGSRFSARNANGTANKIPATGPSEGDQQVTDGNQNSERDERREHQELMPVHAPAVGESPGVRDDRRLRPAENAEESGDGAVVGGVHGSAD